MFYATVLIQILFAGNTIASQRYDNDLERSMLKEGVLKQYIEGKQEDKNMRAEKLRNYVSILYEVLSNCIWYCSFQNFRGNTYKKRKLSYFVKEGNLDFEITVN